jgi:hypothetical protein
MNRKLTLPAVGLAMMVGISGCDLAVQNPNQADRERALASPDDVETLISSSFQSYFVDSQEVSSLASNTMTNRHSASWGNFGMNDLGAEPRQPLQNTTSYGSRGDVFNDHWTENYGAISAATDGIRALDGGIEIGDGGERNARARAFAKFVQALSACTMASWYDQQFIVDETVDLSAGDLTTVPYSTAMADALAKLDEAESLARASSFVLEGNWINGNPLTNTQFANLIVSHRARCRANTARTDADAANTNWAEVLADATSGLGSLVIDGHDAYSDNWYSEIKFYGVENATWHRMHLDWSGMADVSGAYQGWLALPTATRNSVPISTPDLRYPDSQVDQDQGLYHRYNSACCPFRPERGTYRQSHYGDLRHDGYAFSCSFCWFGPFEVMSQTEMDLYAAEAHLRSGNTAGAVPLVNLTRVGNGGLPAVVDGSTVPGGANCVPRKRFDLAGTCGDLKDALIYEHFEEIFQLSGGIEYWFTRRFDMLPSGTALHLPIPAEDLEVLQLDIYTFGGVANAGQPGTAASVIPGDLTSARQRASFSLRALQMQQEQNRNSGRVKKIIN